MKHLALSSSKATIIIAAYNEATTIRQTLSSLSCPESLDTYQILVICNGCSDHTEKIIGEEFQHVHCHSLAKASKALAIRYAESLNPGFPRLYLDADIQLSANHAAALISISARQESASLLIPSSSLNTDGCDQLVKRFYRAWYASKHVIASGYGAGAYLINQSGRQRFGQWPELVADDAFIRSQFCPDEISVSRTHYVTVKAPKTVWTLMKVKTRSKFGNLELKRYLRHKQVTISIEQMPKPPGPRWHGWPTVHWCDQITYLFVNSIALCIAKWQFMTGAKTWHRDNSNR